VRQLLRYIGGHDGAYELLQCFGLGIGEEVYYGTLFDNFTLFNDCHLFGDFFNNFHLVSNHDNGNAHFFIDILQKLENGFYRFRVQGTGGFIGKEDGRIGNDSPGNTYTLFLAAGKLGRILVPVFRKAYQFQNFVDSLCLFCLGHMGQLQRKCHIAGYGPVGKKIEMLENHADFLSFFPKLGFGQLRHVLSINYDLTGCGRLEHIHAANQCRFACAGLSDNTEDFSVLNRKVDVVQCFEIAI